jgi:hypothetical protein
VGFLDKLRGVKGPAADVPAITAEELRQRLLALNHEQVPFRVATEAGDDADLVAEWKIVDADWYEIFGRAGLEKVHRLLLGLDESEHEVRVLEQSLNVEWHAGVPNLSLSVEKFQGRTLGSFEYGKAAGFTGVNPLAIGEIYEYRFKASEMKDPIAEVVTEAGWTWRPVTTKSGLPT